MPGAGAPINIEATIVNRFLDLTMPEPNTGCWLWLGSVNHKGYGLVSQWWLGQHFRAHRLSYLMFRGAFPSDLWVLHKCDTPACVNPDHLFLGTSQDNVDDRNQKGRTARGSSSGRAKLTEQDVISIRASALPVKDIAATYKVTYSTIAQVISGRRWGHV